MVHNKANLMGLRGSNPAMAKGSDLLTGPHPGANAIGGCTSAQWAAHVWWWVGESEVALKGRNRGGAHMGFRGSYLVCVAKFSQ